MYSNTVAVVRHDIQAFLQQAQGADKYFIGQRVLPVLNVDKRSGQYPRIKIGEGSLMRKDVSKRNASGSYNEVQRKHSWDNFLLTDRGLKERIDDDKAADVKDYLDLEVTTGKLVTRNLLIDNEYNCQAALFDEGVFAHEHAKVAYTNTLVATCDFAYDMGLAIEKLILRGADVNSVVISHKLWNYVRRTKMLNDYLFGSEPSKKKLIKAKDVGEAFSEDCGREITVIIASAGYDASNRAKDVPSLSPIWPTSHIWLGAIAGGEFNAGGAGRTLSWTGAVKTGLFQTETWRDEDLRSDMVRVRSYSDQKIIDETAGQLITTGFSEA